MVSNSLFWLFHYCELVNEESTEEMLNDLTSRYYKVKEIARTFDQETVTNLVDSINLDLKNDESNCVGQNFSSLLSNTLKLKNEEYEYMNLFEEAAVRDYLEEIYEYPCTSLYSKCKVCGPMIRL